MQVPQIGKYPMLQISRFAIRKSSAFASSILCLSVIFFSVAAKADNMECEKFIAQFEENRNKIHAFSEKVGKKINMGLLQKSIFPLLPDQIPKECIASFTSYLDSSNWRINGILISLFFKEKYFTYSFSFERKTGEVTNKSIKPELWLSP
jgi:hypothetical protein